MIEYLLQLPTSVFAIIGLLVIFIVYLIDINYFLRTGIVAVNAWLSRKPFVLLEETVLHARVLPFDADILLTHMNNARVLRELDFGRVDNLIRSGLVKYYLFDSLQKYPMFAVAHAIRYRRPLHMFMKYKITTRIVYWEDNVFYHEYKIVTLKDDITRCIGYTKCIVAFKFDHFVEKYHPKIVKPEPPHDLAIWIKFNQANALEFKMRQKRNQSVEEMEAEEWMLN